MVEVNRRQRPRVVVEDAPLSGPDSDAAFCNHGRSNLHGLICHFGVGVRRAAGLIFSLTSTCDPRRLMIPTRRSSVKGKVYQPG